MHRLAGLVLVLWAGAALAQPAGEAPPADAPSDAKPAAGAPAADPGPAEGAGTPESPSPGVERVVEKVAPEAPKAAQGEPADGDKAYRAKITELEGRVNDLKEKIFRSKTRLAILKESVLSSSIAGAEARLRHRNEMGSGFRLEKVSYSLDGQPLISLVDKDGDVSDKEEIEIFNGPIVPGNHTLSVVMVYRGHGFGIFSYLRGYVFNLRSSHTFRAEEGKLLALDIIGYEKGGITTDLKDRPDIRFETKLTESSRGRAADTDG